MKLRRIELFALHLPYSGGEYELSGGRIYTGFDSVMVRLTADDGTEAGGAKVRLSGRTTSPPTPVGGPAPGSRKSHPI